MEVGAPGTRTVHAVWWGPRLVLFIWALLGVVSPAFAQIVTDGTVGAAQSLVGPNFVIPATLGTRAGANLFHSFSTFNIPTGDTATFTGPSGISNVISRVTGGTASTIDGLLASTIPGANVWFLNPAGVMFGPNAQVNVPASLYVTTADEIQFQDGAKFGAGQSTASSLTTAAPEAFGFLGSSSGSISVSGSTLTINNGGALSLIGENVSVTENGHGAVTAPAGSIAIVANGPQENQINVNDLTSTTTPMGVVSISDQSPHAAGISLGTSGNGGGSIAIKGGQFTASNAYIFADNTGSADATGGIDIDAAQIALSQGTFLTADVLGSGRGGVINISASTATIDNSQIHSIAQSLVGGSIDISADNLSLTNGGQISATSAGTNFGANLTVTANTLSISSPSSGTSVSSRLTSDSIDITADQITLNRGEISTLGYANSHIDIQSTSLTLESGALIDGRNPNTESVGGSDINITADNINMDNGSIRSGADVTEIFFFSQAIFMGGAGGGNIDINAGAIQMANQSLIASDAGNLPFNGPVSAQTSTTQITAKTLSLSSQSRIESNSYGLAKAGEIDLSVDQLVIDGANSTLGFTEENIPALTDYTAQNIFLSPQGQASLIPLSTTGVFSSALGNGRLSDGVQVSAAGEGGNINIVAEDVQIKNSGRIESSTSSFGSGGSISINAGTLNIDGSNPQLYVYFSTISSSQGGPYTQTYLDFIPTGVFAEAEAGSLASAGSIQIKAGTFDMGPLSYVSTSTAGLGEAGTINVNASTINMSGASLRDYFTVSDSSMVGSGLSTPPNLLSQDELNNIVFPLLIAVAHPKAFAPDVLLSPTRDILRSTSIQSSTLGPGPAGSVTINADAITLTGMSSISSNSGNQLDVTVPGNPGEINITSNTLTLDSVETSTQGPGFVEIGTTFDTGPETTAGYAGVQPGSININVGDLAMTGNGFLSASNSSEVLDLSAAKGNSITASATGFAAEPGKVSIQARNVEITDAGIESTSQGSLSSGQITVIASNVMINGGEVSTDTSGFGNGGDINITSDVLNLYAGATITSNTSGAGDGGAIVVSAQNLLVDGNAVPDVIGAVGATTGILSAAVDSQSGSPPTGRSGAITITSDVVDLRNGATISAENDGIGKAGNIGLTASGLALADNSSITTQAAAGDGGSITLSAAALDLSNSFVTTTVSSSIGNGGDIQLSLEGLALNASIIKANAFSGRGGGIDISAEQIVQAGGRPSTIEANSTLGVNGVVTLSAPNVNATTGIVALSTSFTDAADLLAETCAARAVEAGSSLVAVGRGGLGRPFDVPESSSMFAGSDLTTTDNVKVSPVALLASSAMDRFSAARCR